MIDAGASTLFHLILPIQRGEERLDARRAGAEIALLFKARATPQMAAYRLARREPLKRANAALQPLAIDLLFPAGWALPWRVWGALNRQNKVEQGTRVGARFQPKSPGTRAAR
jgi:hypothetical protein